MAAAEEFKRWKCPLSRLFITVAIALAVLAPAGCATLLLLDWARLYSHNRPYSQIVNNGRLSAAHCVENSPHEFSYTRFATVWSGLPPLEAWYWAAVHGDAESMPIQNSASSIDCRTIHRLPFVEALEFPELGIEIWRYSNNRNSVSAAEIQSALEADFAGFARAMRRLEIDQLRLVAATLCDEGPYNSFSFEGRADGAVLAVRMVIVSPCLRGDSDELRINAINDWLNIACHETAHVRHRQLSRNLDLRIGRVSTELLAYALGAEISDEPLTFASFQPGALCEFSATENPRAIFETSSSSSIQSQNLNPDPSAVGPDLAAALIDAATQLEITDDLVITPAEAGRLWDSYGLDVDRLQSDLASLCPQHTP